MSRNSKIDPVEKIRVVEGILASEWGVQEAARRLSVHNKTVSEWRDIYISSGPSALAEQKSNKVYSLEDKQKNRELNWTLV